MGPSYHTTDRRSLSLETPLPIGHHRRRFFQRDELMGYAFVAPALFILVTLVAYPFFMAIYFSLNDIWVGRPGRFIGLRNYANLLRNEVFLQTLQNSFVFTISSVSAKTVLGILLALILNQRLRYKKFWRGIILLPWVIPTALSVLGWWWMFDSLYSVFNWTLLRLGVIDVGLNWLGTKHLAMIAVIMVNIWRGLPFFAISTLAGLVSIPTELYEAAETDGASKGQRFFYVTLPLLRPILAIVILFSTIFTFSDFNIVYILTRGGPINSTHLFATLAAQVGMEGGHIGQGAAISLFMFPLLATVVFFQLKLIRKE
jgi:multiple sugar transport system permease protein